MTIVIGWWLVPILISVASIGWALPMRAGEQSSGAMFDGLGYSIGVILRLLCAMVVSLAVWLIWSLAT